MASSFQKPSLITKPVCSVNLLLSLAYVDRLTCAAALPEAFVMIADWHFCHLFLQILP